MLRCFACCFVYSSILLNYGKTDARKDVSPNVLGVPVSESAETCCTDVHVCGLLLQTFLQYVLLDDINAVCFIQGDSGG